MVLLGNEEKDSLDVTSSKTTIYYYNISHVQRNIMSCQGTYCISPMLP